MSGSRSSVYLVRHGETAWSVSGQHTGRTDLPLTERGERNAHAVGARLRGLSFAKVLTSPLRRALRTCELAGFGDIAEIGSDLVEWDYGQYEGRRTPDIQAERPGWLLFRDGCLGGEAAGLCFLRDTGSMSALSCAHNMTEPDLRLWNQSCTAPAEGNEL
jgi:probable phosphoglycerate mutase